MKVVVVPALSDNFSYLVIDQSSGKAFAVGILLLSLLLFEFHTNINNPHLRSKGTRENINGSKE
jgi:hypothetical protein